MGFTSTTWLHRAGSKGGVDKSTIKNQGLTAVRVLLILYVAIILPLLSEGGID